MAAKLNKVLLFCFLFLFQQFIFCQNNVVVKDYPDYKNQEQHKKYYKRRTTISKWQINKLKDGALIVKLKTNDIIIEALRKQGNIKLAEKKKLEQFAVNKTIITAFNDFYKFSKVYFIKSNYTDSLLKGKRTNIFLDTNVQINPSITLTETFYLIAEKDFVYNSSIGFVKEDSAKYQVEQGNSVNEAAFVIKNKYGHQLKSPFPFLITYKMNIAKVITGSKFDFPIKIYKNSLQQDSIIFVVNKNFIDEQNEIKKGLRKPNAIKQNEFTKIVEIKKMYLYDRISLPIEIFNDDLIRFHQNSRMPLELELGDLLIQPYLY